MTLAIAVTGASGFIGGRVAAALAAQGHRVSLLRHKTALAPALARTASRIVDGGIDDPQALAQLLEGADVAVHCGGLVRARHARDFAAVNATGVETLVDAARGAVPRLLLLSSLAARAPHLSAYAASKRAGEEALAARAGALAWAVFRPPAVYGPEDTQLLPLLRLLRHRVALLPAGAAARVSLIHVTDLAGAVVAWVETRERAGGIFEPDDGAPKGYAWPRIVDILSAILGVRPVRIAPPGGALVGIAAITALMVRAAGGRPLFTPGKARELAHPDWVCRKHGLAEACGWRPTLGLEEGMRRTVAWYRSAGLL